MSSEGPLEDLIRRLDDTATRLRDPGLAPDAAAELAEECSRLASQAAAELDRRARAASSDAPG